MADRMDAANHRDGERDAWLRRLKSRKRWHEADARQLLDEARTLGVSCQEHAFGLGLRAARLERWERRLAEAGASAWTLDQAHALDASDNNLLEFVELRANGRLGEEASNEPRASRTCPDSVAIVIHVGANARIEVVRVDDAVAAFVARILAHSAHFASDEECALCS